MKPNPWASYDTWKTTLPDQDGDYCPECEAPLLYNAELFQWNCPECDWWCYDDREPED